MTVAVRRPLEKDVQRACLDYLALAGFFAIRTNSGALSVPAAGGRGCRFVRMNSQPGCSDCLCVCPDGRFLAVEFKRAGNDATAAQLAFLAEVRRRRGLGLVVTSVEDLRRQLGDAGFEM